MKKGYLVVIEGIDGSGKTTQIQLLKHALASQGLPRKVSVPLEAISFPRYGDNIYGELIKRYLEGEFGSLDKVNPYLISLAYAGDRMLAKPLIQQWLSEGKLVIANRYVSSSKAHMGANLPPDKREEFLKWLDKLEYEANGLPKEDLTILLKVDPQVGQKNVSGRGSDLHEDSLRHLQDADKIYLELATTESNWEVIDCMKGEQMKYSSIISEKLQEIIKQKFISSA